MTKTLLIHSVSYWGSRSLVCGGKAPRGDGNGCEAIANRWPTELLRSQQEADGNTFGNKSHN